jgi:two-component system chemotaxis response regulator CheB
MAFAATAPNRDAVVIGASAGGITALRQLLSELGPDVPASVFVVQHLAPAPDSHLADILRRTSALPVAWAEHGLVVERGRVYIAPPDRHLLVDGERVLVVDGPRENRARPSINRLFRSAAASYARRTVGVLLTGRLDDGTAGLAAVRSAGGVSIVQDPREAEQAEMPRSAVEAGVADHVAVLADIPGLIGRLTREPVVELPPPSDLVAEAALDRTAFASPEALGDLGPQITVACPICAGPLWQLGPPGARSYRCYLGHTASAQQLLASQATETERALWSAVRALQERATTLRNLASDARAAGRDQSATEYERHASESHADATRAREFLLGLRSVARDR